jgi:hypothetical protein
MLLDAPAAKGFPSFSVFLSTADCAVDPRLFLANIAERRVSELWLLLIPVISIGGRADILPLLLGLPLVSVESVQSAQRAAQTLSRPSLRHILWTPFNRMS